MHDLKVSFISIITFMITFFALNGERTLIIGSAWSALAKGTEEKTWIMAPLS